MIPKILLGSSSVGCVAGSVSARFAWPVGAVWEKSDGTEIQARQSARRGTKCRDVKEPMLGRPFELSGARRKPLKAIPETPLGTLIDGRIRAAQFLGCHASARAGSRPDRWTPS